MTRKLNLKILGVALIVLSSFLYPLFSNSDIALAQPTSLFSEEEICDPKLPPDNKPGGGCDLIDFLILVRRVIEFILWLIIPIGIAFIAWGAFVIMTSAGSPEKVSRGRKIITAAIIGVALALASWLIVTTVNKILTGYLGQL